MKNTVIKRAAAALTAAVLSASMCSCGEKNAPAENAPVAIEIWHYYNGSLQESFNRTVERFNNTVGAENGITVAAHSRGSISDLENAVLSSAKKQVGSDSLPNIFASYADTAYEVEKTGMLADLNKYLTEEEQAEYVDYYIEEGRMGGSGELYIFPIAKCTETMMLNKTDWEPFAEATGASTDDLLTVEGVAETAEKYYKWSDGLTPNVPDDGRSFFGRDALANYFIIGSKQLGHEIFKAENGSVKIDADRAIMRKLWDNYYVPYINGYFCAEGKYRSDDAKVGKIIALIGSTSSAAYFPNEVTDIDGTHAIEAEVLPLPVFKDGKPVNVQQGAGMAVAKSTPEKEAASVLFLKWFTDSENNIAFSSESGYLPVKKEANDYGFYTKTAEKLGIELKGTNAGVVKEALNCVASHELYTSKAFDGCQQARKVLEYSLADKAAADRAAVKEMIDGGASREEAAAQFNTDENFSEWYDSLVNDLNAAVSVNAN